MRPGLFAASLLLAIPFSTSALALDVIVHADRPEDDVSRSLVRGMFGMRVRAWPDGAPVRVFVLDDSDPLHQEFSKTILQMYPYQLRQNWDRLLYSGTGQPPVVVSSEEELVRRVAETPGAVGYVRELKRPDKENKSGKKSKSRNLPEEPPPNVKVLNVR